MTRSCKGPIAVSVIGFSKDSADGIRRFASKDGYFKDDISSRLPFLVSQKLHFFLCFSSPRRKVQLHLRMPLTVEQLTLFDYCNPPSFEKALLAMTLIFDSLSAAVSFQRVPSFVE